MMSSPGSARPARVRLEHSAIEQRSADLRRFAAFDLAGPELQYRLLLLEGGAILVDYL